MYIVFVKLVMTFPFDDLHVDLDDELNDENDGAAVDGVLGDAEQGLRRQEGPLLLLRQRAYLRLFQHKSPFQLLQHWDPLVGINIERY